ncbi:MAG: hypothetical protein O3C20_23120, partial [Verrucomicrobia bacterium]|nr:hypothetical protein [Verrucomicrobiota bacterium]
GFSRLFLFPRWLYSVNNGDMTPLAPVMTPLAPVGCTTVGCTVNNGDMTPLAVPTPLAVL